MRASIEKLFWPKVQVNGLDECWPWLGSTGEGGYGHCGSAQKRGLSQYAHRIAWTLVRGGIHHELCVLHRCDNRICCNPLHLFLGTNQDNIDDKVRKGRQSRQMGELHPGAKLTPSQVMAIKVDPRSQSKIAKDYGVGRIQISRIQRGEAWSHL